MSMSKIEREAARLLRRVMHRYRERPSWDRRSLSEMIDVELSKYNERVRKAIEPMIYDELSVFGADLPKVVPTPGELSSLLYRNAAQVGPAVAALLMSAQKSGETVGELAKRLYEGYGFRDKETLEVVKKLPEYLRKEFARPHVQRSVIRRVSRLRMSPLRAAYAKVLREVERHNTVALLKAARVALEEKARYYAARIADTESHRAKNLARAKSYLEDDDIQLVRYRMSSRHPMVDICDYYASLDVGYGPGIVPKEQMVALPLHPHCHCRYDPYYKTVRRRKVADPERETLSKFREDDQRRILGSWSGWRKWKNGTPAVEVWNAARPGYPVRLAKEVLDKISPKNRVKMDIRQLLQEIKNRSKHTRSKIIVGELSDDVILYLKMRGVPVHTKTIYLNHKGLSHLARDSKRKRGAGLSDEDILRIPEILKAPSAVFIEDIKDKLNLLYCDNKTKRCIKIVIDTKFVYKGNGITLVKTAGYIDKSDMKNQNFKLIFGEWSYE